MSLPNLPPGVPPLPPNVVVFGPGSNCTVDICPLQFSVYGYRPSLAANISLIALYAVAAVIHIYLGFRWKQWWFMACMLLGAANAIIGYIGRVMMHYNPFNFAAFMLQIICVTTGPVYYCAAIYITIALTINHLSPTLSRFKPKLFYYIFIPCDLFSLALQAAGGGLSTSTSGKSQTGVDLALVGLSFQVFTIVLFCAFFGDYLYRYFRSGVWKSNIAQSRMLKGSGHDGKGRLSPMTRLKLFFGFMVVAILLILARCSYRLAELHEGYRGEMIRDEGLFIGLEGVIILASVYCLMIGHPGLVFKSDVLGKSRASESDELHSQHELQPQTTK
ncbi:sphingoid long-chain base transporter RSB1 [Rhypophila decipiens]|uniref:Sphingoid long-chain base transporter RSB1 n=1 Tax=Rhypophila decipiens TaxID=261697 RepID=A0AAN7BBZ0_9PEZI|nr:sphingoid long-chain base transporter RSB1 [Rhypophila decipiens]